MNIGNNNIRKIKKTQNNKKFNNIVDYLDILILQNIFYQKK